MLIGVGGLVTSKGAGMAVPDWPSTYGYNMFLFPVSNWVGGVFYEHSHRLVASFVGLLTTILVVWVIWRDPRRWMKWLAGGAFVLVVFQGVLGGLRVVLFKDEIGIFHAALAQLFLLLLCCLALFTSRAWHRLGRDSTVPPGRGGWAVLGVATVLIFVQLLVGATMRHQHSGLAVPDFPLAYGKLWPPMDEASLAAINQQRTDPRDFGSVTAFQIGLHMTHRIGAVVVLLAVAWALARILQGYPGQPGLRRWARVWMGMILLQAFLGAWTVWSKKAADVATAHVVLGAASLALGGLLTLVARKISVEATVPVLHPAPGPSPVAPAKTPVQAPVS